MPLTRRAFTSGAAAAGAFAATGAAQAPQAGLAWRALSQMPASAQEIYPTLWNGKIVVAGGFAGTANGPWVTDKAFLYDPDTDAWTVGPELPAPRHHPQLAVAGGALHAVGGFVFKPDPTQGTWEMQAGAWVYDETESRWAEAPSLPAPRAEAVPLAFDGRFHLIGGRAPAGSANANWGDHADVAEHLVLDPALGRWETLAPAPTARNSAAGVVLEGKIYVVGGRRVDAGNNAELEVYDSGADRWDGLAPMPQGQGGLAAGVIGGRIVAFGGEFFGPGGGGVYPETWVYDPARDAWEPGPAMLTPRHGLGGVSLGDRIYAIGGATEDGARGTSAALEMLTLG
jgi:N-acetylneuraminic acid mutarotase